MTKPPSDCGRAVDRINQLLGEMQAANLCACCCARALMTMGAALAEEIGGIDAAVEELEGLAADMSNNVKEAPERGTALN